MHKINLTMTMGLAVLFLACADSAPIDPVAGGQSLQDGGMSGDRGNLPPGNMMNVPVGSRSLMIVGNSQPFTLTGTTLDLQVAYNAGNVPVSNARVNFRLLDENGAPAAATGIQGSVLTSSSSLSNTDGVAQVRLRTGQTDAFFLVEASADGARAVRWQVTVGNAGLGSLDIRLIYQQGQGRYMYRDFARAEVLLFNAQGNRQNCQSLGQNPGAIFNADLIIDRVPFNEVDNRVVAPNLMADSQYTIAAIAYSSTDSPLAFGCMEGQNVEGGMATSFDLPLSDLDLQYKGRFKVLHTFNLRSALSNSDDPSLNSVSQLMDYLQIIGGQGEDRAEAVERVLCDLLDLGGAACRTIGILVGNGNIDRILNEFIANESPELLQVFQALADIVKILEEMTIVGEFEFIENNPNAEGVLINNDDRWKKFRFSWRNGCPPGRQCENREFTIGDIHTTEDGREAAIFSPFNAQIAGRQMVIQEHTMQVRYGLILLGIAEHWVIPSILNENGPIGIDVVLQELLPCESINNLVGDNSFCEDILAAGLSQVLREVIGDLSFADDGFTIQGTVTPVDVDGDLIIDKLEGGIWRGRLGDNSMFDGCFNGCRGLDCTPDPCLPPQ